MEKSTNTDLKKLAQQQRSQGDFKGALQTLQKAIDQAGAELADLHGIMGGTKRQQGDLIAAASAYDIGFHLDERHHAASTYNALNRLVARILLEPRLLSDPDLLRDRKNLEFVDVRQELCALQKQLESQAKGERSHDFWCAGDLAVTAALNADLEVAVRAVEQSAGMARCDPASRSRSRFRPRSALRSAAQPF